MENEKNIFSNILNFSESMVAEHGLCDHDLRKEIKIIA